jgi:hypothetical protein
MHRSVVADGTSNENRAIGFALQSLLYRVNTLAIPALLGLFVKIFALRYVFIIGSIFSSLLLFISLFIFIKNRATLAYSGDK